MVSIHGLPSIANQRKTQKAKANKAVSKGSTSSNSTSTTQVTKVAQAVSHSVKHLSQADISKAQIHYDLPEGRSKKALDEYMSVMNQAKREELQQLLGVDIYI